MKLLFKSANATNTTEVGHTNFKNHYPSVSSNANWNELKTYIRQATDLYVIPYIGQEWYDKLADDFHADSVDVSALSIVEKLQDAIAYYTIYKAMPFMPFVVSAVGVQKAQSSQGAAAISAGEAKNIRWNAHLDADRMLDDVLKLLTAAPGTYFDLWHTYANKLFKTSAFFKTAAELNTYLNIQQSRRAFQVLVPHLHSAEEQVIKIIGRPFFAHLTTMPQTELEGFADGMICRYIAQQALYEAIPYLTLVIESDGFMVVSRGDGTEERNSLKHQQHENAILRLREAAREKAAEYKSELIAFLWEKKADFPLWQASDLYKSMAADTTPRTGIIVCGNGGVFLN
jgi:hypothetical protein